MKLSSYWEMIIVSTMNNVSTAYDAINYHILDLCKVMESEVVSYLCLYRHCTCMIVTHITPSLP